MGEPMSRPSRRAILGRDQKMLTAVKEALQGLSTLYLAVTTFTPQTLAAYLQNRMGCGSSPAEGIGARSVT